MLLLHFILVVYPVLYAIGTMSYRTMKYHLWQQRKKCDQFGAACGCISNKTNKDYTFLHSKRKTPNTPRRANTILTNNSGTPTEKD